MIDPVKIGDEVLLVRPQLLLDQINPGVLQSQVSLCYFVYILVDDFVELHDLAFSRLELQVIFQEVADDEGCFLLDSCVHRWHD